MKYVSWTNRKLSFILIAILLLLGFGQFNIAKGDEGCAAFSACPGQAHYIPPPTCSYDAQHKIKHISSATLSADVFDPASDLSLCHFLCSADKTYLMVIFPTGSSYVLGQSQRRVYTSNLQIMDYDSSNNLRVQFEVTGNGSIEWEFSQKGAFIGLDVAGDGIARYKVIIDRNGISKYENNGTAYVVVPDGNRFVTQTIRHVKYVSEDPNPPASFNRILALRNDGVLVSLDDSRNEIWSINKDPQPFPHDTNKVISQCN